MKMIIRTILAVSTLALLTTGAKECCEGVNVVKERFCTNGERVNLNCTKKYLLDQDMYDGESFEIDENGYLLYSTPLDSDTRKMPFAPDRYCITRIANESEPQVAIVCFDERMDGDFEQKWFELRAICSLLSVVFLLMTLLVYILVPNLRDLQGKCIMHALALLSVSLLNLSILQLTSFSQPACLFYSFLTYFTFMATFFWLNITSFHIWKTSVMPNISGTENQWYNAYLSYGYGMPTFFLVVLLCAHHIPGDHIAPDLGTSKCWFGNMTSSWAYFYGPISVLLAINLILFIWSIYSIWWESKHCDERKMKSLKYKIRLYASLFLVMGINWLFEVISAVAARVNDVLDVIWSITDYINILQGVLIFLLLVVLRKRALRGLSNKGFCCITFPGSWKTLEDQEVLEEEEEERQLPNGNP